MSLLIHSMAELSDIVLPALAVAGARHVAEIGAEFGGMSQMLADHAAAAGGTLTSVVTGIEKFREIVDTAGTGENVGLLLADVAREDVGPGDVVSA